MTRTELERSRRIEYEGADGDCLLFSTSSWTRGDAVKHHITADFKEGIATCSCEDGFFHSKYIEILTGLGQPCKHLLAVWQLCKRILEANND